jgi:CubicO group peptidase (beta-lactamase class C family)
MVDTAHYVPEDKLERAATLYGEDNWVIEQKPITEPPLRPQGDTGLFSTTADYLRFCRMLLNGGELDGTRILGRKTVAYMATNHLPADLLPFVVGITPHPGYGFGLGVEVMIDPPAASVLHSVGAYGWGGLASTYFRIDPAEDIIVLKMAQIIHRDHDGNSIVSRNANADIHTVAYQALVD